MMNKIFLETKGVGGGENGGVGYIYINSLENFIDFLKSENEFS